MTGPLAGIRIVMMGGLGPGPFCAMLLGDLGADVIRVDRVDEVGRDQFLDHVVRRSQRSIAIDVKDERGAELVRSLVAGADAFVDVFRPGVIERLGLGPDDLLDRNPRLVYARMTGYGQDGPMAQMAGHDINYLAMSGALHAIGTPETPVPPLNLVGDYGGGGMLLALGLLSGILEARQSGTGQVVDVAMVDGVATLMAVFYGLLAEGRWADRRSANVLDGAAHYYRAYETADGQHLAIGAMEPQFYAELCQRLDVDVPQGGSAEQWAAHAAVMGDRIRQRTRAEWEDELVHPQTCATPVLSLREAPEHPHNRARGTFVEIDGVVQPAPSPRFSRTVPGTPGPPALPGAHTEAILAEIGVDPNSVAGVVAQTRTAESLTPRQACVGRPRRWRGSDRRWPTFRHGVRPPAPVRQLRLVHRPIAGRRHRDVERARDRPRRADPPQDRSNRVGGGPQDGDRRRTARVHHLRSDLSPARRGSRDGVLRRRPAAHGRGHRLCRLAGRGDGLRLQRWGVDAVL